MPPSGKGRRKILIVGEAPGQTEDEQNRQFVGKAGEKLSAVLHRFGIDLWKDCWIVNALSCRPPGNKIDDPKKIDYCRPLVTAAIKKFRPRVIVTLGAHALRSVVAPLWGVDTGEIGRWTGMQIPARPLNCWVCPTWHPSYLLRQNDPVLDLWFRNHLESAIKLADMRPWGPKGTPPDYAKQIEIIPDPAVAANRIRQIELLGDLPATFDFETDRLKPDADDARIVCAAICWEGRKTIAFPFAGPAIAALGDWLRSPAPKHGWNSKFEERWVRKIYGFSVNNWQSCGMINAHVGDNRPGVSGLKFQAFARLGFPPYNEHIKPYLEGSGGNGKNKIDQIPLNDLLQYCGLDALLEWIIGEQQRRELGYAE